MKVNADARRNRKLAWAGLAVVAAGLTLGPYGLLIARATECVWEVCVSNALIYGLGSAVAVIVGLFLLLEFWLRD